MTIYRVYSNSARIPYESRGHLKICPDITQQIAESAIQSSGGETLLGEFQTPDEAVLFIENHLPKIKVTRDADAVIVTGGWIDEYVDGTYKATFGSSILPKSEDTGL